MRGSTVCSLLMISLLSHGPAAAEPDAPGQSYGPASTGLDYPDMEGGRTEIELVDLDLDGNIDLVMVGDHGSPNVNTDQHGVTVWFGDGAGVWTPVQYGDFGYGGIAVGDVNGDGLLDVGYGVHHNWSATDLGDQILEVALGNGSGTFWTAWDDGLAGNGETWGMMGSDFADVDGDGDLDLGSISFGCCNGVHVYLNHGDGSWTQSFENSGRNSNQEFVFGEIDGDGWPDFVASHSLGTVYLNDGNGGFIVADQGLPPTDEFAFLPGVSLGDVNGDGRDDLAWVNDDGGVEVWTRNVAGTWIDISGALPDTGSYSATQLWDLDGDGITDVAAFGSGQATTWKGDGAGGFAPLGAFTTQNPGTYTAFRTGGDVDHNGYPDFAVISRKQVSLFDDQNVPQCFVELTPPAVLQARIEKPVPGATLRSGSAAFVHWAAEVPGTDPATVDLEYSVHGAAGPWHEVGTGLPNNGRHQWIVPDAAGAADFRLRVTAHTPGGSASGVNGGALNIAFGSGTVELRFDDADTLSWTDRTTGRTVYNLYRGDWDVFRTTGEYTQPSGGAADRWCGVTAGSQDDPYLPAAGAMVFYLASGDTDGLEGSLDADSSGAERSNANPCN